MYICRVALSCFQKNVVKNFRIFQLKYQLIFYCHSSVKSSGCKMEESDVFDPPNDLHGMKVLDKNAFCKTVKVPCLEVKTQHIGILTKHLKKYFFKFHKVKPVQVVDEHKQKILLNPCLIKSWRDFSENMYKELEKLDISEKDFQEMSVDLGYDNWTAAPLLKAVLPKDEPPLTSYAIIGHIVHLNIKEHLLDYKHIIGQILLDKVTSARTVIYKTDVINNVYRNFKMEVLCGDPDFLVFVKENGCQFEFDFSKVYWNPRLATEHSRIVSLLQARDVLFDVFAGVGPFAIPAAKKQCFVHANDLNPESFKWLNHNIKLNKKTKDYVTTYNKDGGDFILNDVRENLVQIWRNICVYNKIHVVMNLPASALEFIKHFKGLVKRKDLSGVTLTTDLLPVVHCYFFSKFPETEKEVFEKTTGLSLSEVEEHAFHFVRLVSNGKSMHRITLRMPASYLVDECESDVREPLTKRLRTN